MDKTLALTVNGVLRKVTTDPQRPLLEVLREDLELTGTKYGCGEGRCGACTVLVGDRSTASCITPVGQVENQTVLTIEGLAQGDKLHPVQEAFLAEKRVPVRLLHAGHDHGRGRLAPRQAQSDRGRDPLQHGRASLPLLRLSGNPQGDRPRRGGGEATIMSADFEIGPSHVRQVLGAGLLVSVEVESAQAQPRGGRRGGGGTPAHRRPRPPRPGRHDHRPDRQGREGPGRPGGTDPGRRRGTPRAARADPAGDGRHGPRAGRRRSRPAAAPRPRRCPPSARARPPRGNSWCKLACRRWQVAAEALEVRDGKIADAASQAHARLRRSGRGRRVGQALRAGRAGRRDAHAGEGVEGAGHVGAAAEPPRPGDRRAPLPLRHRAAGHAVRQGAAPAVLRREAGRDRPRAGQGDEGRGGRAGRPVRRRGGPDDAPRPAGPGGHRRRRPSGSPPRTRPARSCSTTFASHARGGVPANPFAAELAAAGKVLKQTYHVPYVQHAPLEPRAAVAEWSDGKLTVWTGTQNPFGYRGELARAFQLAEDQRARDRARLRRRLRRQAHAARRPSRRRGWPARPAARSRCAGRARRSSPGPTSARRR